MLHVTGMDTILIKYFAGFMLKHLPYQSSIESCSSESIESCSSTEKMCEIHDIFRITRIFVYTKRWTFLNADEMKKKKWLKLSENINNTRKPYFYGVDKSDWKNLRSLKTVFFAQCCQYCCVCVCLRMCFGSDGCIFKCMSDAR